MTELSFHDLVAESNTVPWNRNWKSDAQPGKYSTSEYRQIAKELRIEALRRVKTFLERVPSGVIKDDNQGNNRYYTLEPRIYHGVATTTIDELIAEIVDNDKKIARKNQLSFALNAALNRGDSVDILRIVKEAKEYADVVADERFLKSETRTIEKLKEYQVNRIDHPEMIGDYLRMQILFDTAEDIAAARHEMQFGNTLFITSQKDKLRRCDEEGSTGHRSFMAHAVAENQNRALKFEIMLSLYQAETFEIDKSFRDSERTSLKMATQCTAEQATLSNTYFSLATALGQMRKIELYKLYATIKGMNDMLDPDVDVDGITHVAEATADFYSATCSHLIKRLPTPSRLYPQYAEQDTRQPH